MRPKILAIEPPVALPGARVAIHGDDLPVPQDGPPDVRLDDLHMHVVVASTRTLRVIVPEAATGGRMTIRLHDHPDVSAPIDVGTVITSGVHQVDGPAYDRAGRLYVTQSGGRDTKVTVPLFRVGRDGVREPLSAEIPNPTSLAFGPDERLYVSSRFDGQVYRLTADDRAERYASELGVPTGLAFAPDGTLFVGDRSGTVLRVSPDRHVETFASLPASVAAFHLAYGPDGCLYVTAPTLATHDGLYRVTPDGTATLLYDGFGRPQGLAFDSSGALFVVEALAGAAGVFRVDVTRSEVAPTLVVTAPALIGLAFDPLGGLALASSDTIWKVTL